MRQPLGDFRGARVAITGGTTGIGQALARRMASQGAHLAVCGLPGEALERARDQLTQAGAASVLVDAVTAEAPTFFGDWIDNVANILGGIDVGWNNAGIMPPPAPIQNMSWNDYRRVMAINLDAVVAGSQSFARHMIQQGSPALLMNTGSENSLFHGVPGGGAYVASKQAVRAITESLYQDLPEHIDVKLLCPGFVGTPLVPEAARPLGMDVEHFADIAFPLLTRPQFYLVTHGFNAVRVREREAKLLADIEAGGAPENATKAFDTYTLMNRSPFWD